MPRLNSMKSSKNTDVPIESWLLLYDTSRREQSTESFSGSVLRDNFDVVWCSCWRGCGNEEQEMSCSGISTTMRNFRLNSTIEFRKISLELGYGLSLRISLFLLSLYNIHERLSSSRCTIKTVSNFQRNESGIFRTDR